VPDAALRYLLVPGRPLVSATDVVGAFGPALLGKAQPAPTKQLAARLQTPIGSTQLGLIVAGIAHELGNPLAVVSSSLQYLDQLPLIAEQDLREFTQASLQNVDRIQSVIRNMRDRAMARPAARREILLNDLLAELLQRSSDTRRQQQVEAEVSFDAALPPVQLAPEAAQEILGQLLHNAYEALADGGHKLLVETHLAPDGDTAMVVIGNDGPAIPAEVQQDMFRPFYSTREGHAGLGLYLARRNAMENSGSLSAESDDAGTRFILRLPLAGQGRSGNGSHPHRR